MKNGKKLAIGTVVGAVTGFAAGILFAPKSGKETRKDIKNAVEKAVKKVHEEAEQLLAQAKKIKNSLSAKAKAELSKIEQRVRSARDKVAGSAKKAVGKKDDKDLQAALTEANEAFEHLKKFLKNASK